MVDGRMIRAGKEKKRKKKRPYDSFLCNLFQPTAFILMRGAATDYQVGWGAGKGHLVSQVDGGE